ncbi:MAG: hypothetical protein BMS9Abin25_1264 [Gammaproteobacteria bacterium]|nr:MAG: hypothetical protein BMS9Abin25_1264 [Gammaproteobacteria bacterium]
MPLTRLIILLSALLVISPLMSPLAMASASHSMEHSEVSAKVVVTGECSCRDQITGQTCSDLVCQCDASVLALIFPIAVSRAHPPQITNTSSRLQNPLDRVQAVIIPPPIPSL